MNVDDVLRILVDRSDSHVDYSNRISDGVPAEHEFASWSAEVGLEPTDLLDQLGFALARGYDTGALSFAACDFIANDLNAFAENHAVARGDVFWEVYLAFDAGEFIHPDNPLADPEQAYTRPAIAALLAGTQKQ